MLLYNYVQYVLISPLQKYQPNFQFSLSAHEFCQCFTPATNKILVCTGVNFDEIKFEKMSLQCVFLFVLLPPQHLIYTGGKNENQNIFYPRVSGGKGAADSDDNCLPPL